MVDKLLNELETIVLVPAIEINGEAYLVGPTGVELFDDGPSIATLNHWHAITDPSSQPAGGNISRAVRDDLTLGLTDSDTDDDRDINAEGNAVDLTTKNFEAELTGFRDADLTASGRYNLFRDLVRKADVPYGVFHRIGFTEDTAFAAGHEVDGYYVHTDNPVPGYADGGNQTTTQSFVSKNKVLPGFVLA